MASKKLLFPILGAMAVSGGAAAYYVMTNATVQGPAAIARYMPDETAVAISLTPNEKAWSQLDKFGTPAARKLITDQLTKLEKDSLKDTGIDFNQDIKPWLGEVMLGVLPIAGEKPNAQPEMLVAATIKDKGKALNFQNKLKDKVKVEPESIEYKGYKISKYSSAGKDQAKAATPTFTLLVQDTLLIASSQKAMEAAIDTLKGEPSMASLPQIKSLLSDDLKVENVVARVYLPSAENLTKLVPPTPGPNALAQLQAYKAGSAVLGIDAQGVRVRSRVSIDPKNPAAPKYSQSPGKIAGYFPAQTFAFSSGYDLNALWQQTLAQVESNTPEAKGSIAQMRQAFTAQTQLDLDKDVMGWMKGEFALGLMQESNNFGGVGGALLVQTSDRAAADKALAQLNTVASKMGIPVNSGPNSAKPMAAAAPAGTPALSHGWVDDKTLYLTISPVSAQALASKPSDALTNSATYKTVTSTLPKNHAGTFYLDMAETVKLLQPYGGISGDAATILDSITGVGMTSSPTTNGVVDGEFLLALKATK